MKKFVGDFETCTWLDNETYVWAWALCEIGNEKNIHVGNNIEIFFEYLKRENNPILYMHNLSFDGEFIIYYLLKHGYTHIENTKDRRTKTFQTLISDTGQFYQITIYLSIGSKIKKITIIDSLKIIPFKVEIIAESFGIEEKKLSLDYKKPRERGHILTKAEENYIMNDVIIVSKALNQLFNEGLTHMTQSSNAMKDFKGTISNSTWTTCFPVIKKDISEEIKMAYKGGWCYLNKQYKDKDLKNIIVIDSNSLYPSIMKNMYLPYGEPVYFEGQYKKECLYSLYVQMISCTKFKLKENKLPTIQIKHKMEYTSNEYIEEYNDGERVCLMLTNIDLELFLNNYEVEGLRYLYGYKFKCIKGIFNEYIDKWYARKIEGVMFDNKGKKTIAKLMLNSLSGKFASSIEYKNKIPYIAEDNCVHYKTTEPREREGIYAPTSIFITAYGRKIVVETAEKIREFTQNKYGYDSFVYSDTDSVHAIISEEDLKEVVEIDKLKLGAWKIETKAEEGKYIKQKCYILKEQDQIKAHCSGMNKTCYSNIEWEKFKTGYSIPGNLKKKRVQGGIVLVETDFTIKDEQTKSAIANVNI